MSSKRQFLGKIAGLTAASSLRKVWIPPAVIAVSLPVHAQTSNSVLPQIAFSDPRDFTSPFTITISDDNPGFTFQIDSFLLADFVSSVNFPPQSGVVNGRYEPPLMSLLENSNSGAANIITRTYVRRLQSDVRYVVTVIDSDGQRTTASVQVSTP
ncbi:MAG: hypothetical protein KTR18_14150 [Acidiferrobacterales bacterium]|nr:hypothetical protein [Acidiferrobacterales bacterium]